MSLPETYSVEEAVKAQRSLREAAGLEPERFPVQAFVGMISDEIEILRDQGKTDDEIASIICDCSAIQITADEIARHYAAREDRHQRD